MPKLTPKQEKFCQRYMATGNASQAYRDAYDCSKMKPASVNREAKALMDNPNIASRINQLFDRQLKRHDVTVDSITAELEEARTMARLTMNPSAAVSASMGKAKLHGLIVDKGELTGKDGGPIETSELKLTRDERAARIAELLAKRSGGSGTTGAS